MWLVRHALLWRRRAAAAVVAPACLLAGLPLLAQQPAPVDRSLRLFVVMAAINAAGYDAGLNSEHASPVRRLIRQEVAAAQPPSLEALRAFYAAHRHPDSARTLSQFISFGLFLGGFVAGGPGPSANPGLSNTIEEFFDFFDDPMCRAPFLVATDRNGAVYTVCQDPNNVFRIDPDGTLTEIIDGTGDGSSDLLQPHGLAVDSALNDYVSGGASNNVFKIDVAGIVTEIVSGGVAPRDLVLDSN